MSVFTACVPTGSLRPRRARGVAAALTFLVGVLVTGCSSGPQSAEEDFPDTYESYFASFSYDYNPVATTAEMKGKSDVAVVATLVDVEDGRIFGDGINDPAADHSLNLVFESQKGKRYYVGLPRPADSTVARLRSVLPIGSTSVIFLQKNNDPNDGHVFNVRADGNEWYFTTPQGWILEHPSRGVVAPLLSDEGESPKLADAPAQRGRLVPGDWLPDGPKD